MGAGQGKSRRAKVTVDEFYQQHTPDDIIAALNAPPPDYSSLPIDVLDEMISAQRDAQATNLVDKMHMTAVGNWEGKRFVPIMNFLPADDVAWTYFAEVRFSAAGGWGGMGLSQYGFDRLHELRAENEDLAQLILAVGHSHNRSLEEREEVASRWPDVSGDQAIADNTFGAVLTPAVLIAAGYSPSSEEVKTAKAKLLTAVQEASDVYARENPLKGYPGTDPASDFAKRLEYSQLPVDELSEWLDEFVLESGKQLLECKAFMGKSTQEEDAPSESDEGIW